MLERRKLIVSLMLSFLLVLAASMQAATIEIKTFGDYGWRSDDTRNSAGTDLVGINFTNAGKPGQTPTAADDAAIAQQIKFAGGPLGATYGGVVSMDGTLGNNGKSNISTINTTSFFAPASDLVGGSFTATYGWYMQPNPTVRTLAFKIGIQSIHWGTGVGQSQNSYTALRSGESEWDLVLVHVDGAPVANAWNTPTVDLNNGQWYLYRQASNANWVGIAGSLPPAGPNTLAGWQADGVWGPILFGAGANISSIQFGLGSSQRDCIAHLDYLQTSIYNGGDLVNFVGPVKNINTGETFAGIQEAIDDAQTLAGHTIEVAPGTYLEDVNITKALTLQGAGIDVSTIVGLKTGANLATVRVATAAGVIVDGFTITRDGNNVTDWNTNVKSVGFAVQGMSGNAELRNCKITGNRNGIDLNFTSGNNIHNNIIDFNRTGMIFRNQCPNNTIVENYITNNWTVGVLWLAFSTEDATGTVFFNNKIEGNWYTEIENRSLTGGVKNFSGNWLGSATLTTANTNGSEPGYSLQIPVEYGGTSTPPGGAVSVRGAGISEIDFTPWLGLGTDTDISTGNGIIGFQGDFSELYVDDDYAQLGAVGRIQEGIDLVSGSTVNVMPGTYVLASTVNVNKPNVTIDGAGAGLSIVQVSAAVGYAFNLSTAGVTLRDLEIQKTDLVTNHALIYVAANNLSILNNLIYGPDPGTPWSVNGIVSRAMIGTGGLSGLLIDGNTIHTLRQPGYFSGPTTGTISNNAVSGTRGWVNEGANLTFTNNSWPLPPNQGAEIALLPSLGANGPIWYPDPMALSLANNNAYVDAQFTPTDKGRAVSYVDDSAAPGGFGSSLAPLQTIGAAVSSGVLTTGTVNVAAGNYVDNLVVTKPMTLLGAGSASTFVVPALSAPNPGSGSLPPGASNLVLVQANNVLINGFTFDGNNPALTSGLVVGGADLDARNGIITNHPLGVFNNLMVEYCTVKNIYLRAIYASSGGTFNFHHNVVDNVNGESNSIGMFNFGGGGVFDHNTVSNCNDAIASNWSTGCAFTYNTVTASGSGIHTDNAGSTGGSTADLIENNNISNSPTNGYGIFVFAPYIAPTVNLNTITNVDVALTCAGSNAVAIPVVQFTNNIADGMGKPNSAGIYVTTDIWGFGSGNVSVNFANNSFSNFVEGAYLVAEAGKTALTVLTDNEFMQNGLGISNGVGSTFTSQPNIGTSINATLNLFVNTANATDNKSGNVYDQNCWGDWSGVGTYAVGGTGGNIDANPSNSCGMDMTPNTIVYNCAGNFTFDVNIGEGVTMLDAANIWLEYPAELTVASVTALDGNFFLAYSQVLNSSPGRSTLKVNLGVLVGTTSGPDGLFTVAMNGSTSCVSGDITMTYLDLRDNTNAPIVVPMASPVDFQSNCADPTIVVNSPVTGGFYNTNPVLSLTAGDDCDLSAVFYQIDGCTPGGWLPIATGLTGTAYNNAAWSMTGAEFTALTEASHCIRFKVTDDFGRANSDSCTYTWCFTKDITAPLAPTALVAQPGHNKIQLTWTNSSSADVVGVKIQRVPWTDSPDYGSAPTPTPAPAYPANQGVGTTVHTAAATPSSAASHLDVIGLSNATRDIYYFGAFAYDAAGNYSVAAVPAQARATSYWLGDIGLPFDGNVYFTDLTVFTSTYGLNEGQGGYVNHADFGPTHNNSPKGIPLPDDMVEFEDLAIFAINFNNVAPMAAKNTPTLTGVPIEQTAGLKLVDRLTNDGYYVDLYLSNRSNDAKSLIGEISFDPTQLTYISSTIGNDLASPSLPIFYKPLVGDNKVSISAAVLGQGSAFTGSGVVATLKFQTRSATAPRARLTRAEIRDNENNSIVEQIQIVEQPEPISDVALPTRYTVGQNSPNPFNPETSISYGLPTATKVSIRVYNIMGQLVRTLVDDYQAAGTHEVVWNGTTDSGSKVASGIYFYRFETADFQKTVKMTMLK